MSILFNKKALARRRKELRNNMTFAEKLLWRMIRNRQVLKMRFRRQVSIGSYVVDFYAPQIRLAIELDGSIHNLPEVKSSDAERENDIRRLCIHILRIENEDVYENPKAVVLKIRSVVTRLQAELVSRTLRMRGEIFRGLDLS